MRKGQSGEETACEAGEGGGSAHGVACERGLYPVDTGEPQQFFFFLSRAQFTDIQIHSFSVYTCAGFAK